MGVDIIIKRMYTLCLLQDVQQQKIYCKQELLKKRICCY